MPPNTPAAIREASRALSAADFPRTIRSHYPYWDAQYRPFLLLAVDAFPLDRLDFKPRPDMLTARQMILHLAEAERWWISAIVDGGPYEDYVVAADDPAEGWVTVASHAAADHAALRRELETWHAPTQHWLDQPPSELSRVIRYQPPEGAERVYTLHWILDHVQEHELHHRAQLNLYLRLMGLTPPSV